MTEIGFIVLLAAAAMRWWESATDAEIAARVLNGNVDDFEGLVVRYRRQVYSVVLRVVRSPADADDVAQEAFVRAFQALSRYDAARPFAAWISRIAMNAALSLVAKRKKEEYQGAGTEEVTQEMALADAEENEFNRAVRKAVGNLPDGIREAFQLRAFADLSYDEIAEALEIPRGTVMSRLARARERLSETLEKQGFGYENERGSDK